MKKNFQRYMMLALLVLASIVLFGCAKDSAPAATTAPAPAATPAATVVPAPAPTPAPAPVVVPKYQDGIYFAMDEAFGSSGWKEAVTITVQGGKIVSADWNGVNVNGGVDKKTYDKAGKYNMVTYGKAQAEWYQQAEKAEAYLLATQDPAKITYSDAEGHTDDIAGVSVHVSAFFKLADKALAAGPVGRGPYADGTYFAIDADFPASGWKEYVSITVLNGRIAAVNWSGVNKTGDEKKAYDKAGKYNMVAYGKAQAEWYQQAEKVEAYLVANQDAKALTYKDAEGRTDDIAGVSIHVAPLFELVEKALAAGPVSMGKYTDGGYYASEEAFSTSGWKGFVSLMVVNGNIVSVNWSGVNAAGDDKKAFDMAGKYNMVAYGKAIDEWYVQAGRVEQHLVKVQDAKKISLKDESGHTDDISGATITINDFLALVDKALAAGVKKY
ncbi:MAG: hypothetical protein CVV52_01300 [Spirochaetae bacterium HGW-Spirochaetae-8]|jgi:major membrane immunogen (membrane-anchored lipoprotein)|nr:MAG: hypothetical protein CVV52_01300 [Spirochaetae bacterium HGW-Spirochaetae-8]